MAESLSQAEIDALRDAVKSGKAKTDEPQAEAAPPTSQIKVVEYNFRKPQIVSADQLQTLQMLHETVTKNLQTAFFASLKTGFEIKLVAVDQISYAEFVMSLANPTHVTILHSKPSIGSAAFDMNLTLVMTMLDIMLGGNGATASAPRELTALEADIFRSMTDLFVAELSAGWASLWDGKLETGPQESNPEYLQLTTPETPCLSITFDVRIAEVAGAFTLCYPFVMLQAVLTKLSDRAGKRALLGERGKGDEMLPAVKPVPLQLRAVLGSATISAQQLGMLRTGDVIPLRKRFSNDADIYIGSRLCFRASMGRRRGKTAVCLARAFHPPPKNDKPPALEKTAKESRTANTGVNT
jgi:flagellar motor switch protein FliM